MLCFKYRVYPSGKQQKILGRQMHLSKELYNLLLEKCKEHYSSQHKTLSKYSMTNIVTQLKQERLEFNEIYSQVLQNVCDRVSKAYKNFFARCKRKKKGEQIEAGFPRFKKYVVSLTYPQSGFKMMSDKKIRLSNIGSIPIVLHRLPRGKAKTLTIKKLRSNKWYMTFSCEMPESKINLGNKSDCKLDNLNPIGIDVGLESFCTFSDGTKVENPRLLKKSLERIKHFQREVSNKVKGSKNRRKAIVKLARAHEKVDNQRADFLHKLSSVVAKKYSLVAIEKLKISNMLKNHRLAQSITDVSWNSFIQMLHYKAQSAGCEVIEVDPRNTSQMCSNCGTIVKKSLSDRIHKCHSCGFTADRDTNSARNILIRATVGLTGSHACGDSASTLCVKQRACRVLKTGTI